MAVDDHAINSLRTWFDLEYEELKNEWKSKRYEKLSECPSFKSTTAYHEAMNILIKACYGDVKNSKTLQERLEEELELENFWKDKSK